MGLGYAVPYLAAVRPECERTLAFMPASQGVVNWPASGLSSSALVDSLAMPLPDASIDRVLVVHEAVRFVQNSVGAVPGPLYLAVSAAAVAVLLLFFVAGPFLQSAQDSVATLFASPGAFFGLRP